MEDTNRLESYILECGVWNFGSRIPQPVVSAVEPSAIPNPQSPIPNPQSAIPNPQSAIRNPQSAIRNPHGGSVRRPFASLRTKPATASKAPKNVEGRCPEPGRRAFATQ